MEIIYYPIIVRLSWETLPSSLSDCLFLALWTGVESRAFAHGRQAIALPLNYVPNHFFIC